MPTRRSDRTRGTRPDKMRPDLRARQMVPGSNKVRGAVEGPGVSIVEVSAGFCSYIAPATDCVATGSYEVIATGPFVPPPVDITYFWEITAGTATIVSPTTKTTDITTDSGVDQTFRVRCTVSSVILDISVSDERTFTHEHTETVNPDNRVDGDANARVDGDGNRRIAYAA